MDEEKKIEKKKEKKSGKIGAILGASAGTLGTIMANPIGKWAIFQSQDEVGRAINRTILDLTNNPDLSFGIHRAFDVITNTIMAYPVVLPVAGGVIAAGLGTLIDKRVSSAKLKRKSLEPVTSPKKKLVKKY